jgi:hypothetical protein
LSRQAEERPIGCGASDGEPASATLGAQLKLPGFLEPRRKELEAVLPPLEVAA